MAPRRRLPAKLRAIKLDELSLVDKPANPHARVTLFKRGHSDDRTSKDYVDTSAPVLTAREVSALSFDEVLAEEQAREAAMQVKDNIYSRWWSLQRSFETIAEDEDVSPADKVTDMQRSLQQFIASLEEQSKVVADAVTKSLSAVPALAELLPETGNSSEGDEPMTAAEKKQLEELQKTVANLTKQLEAANADDPAKKNAELQKQLDEATVKIDELTQAAEQGKVEKEEALVKAKMTDAEKDFMDLLDKDDDKKRFMSADKAERRRMMNKADDDNPVVYKSERTGEEFRKNDDARLVVYAKQADEDARIAQDERTKRENSELTKRAEDELSDFTGEVVDKVGVLRAIDQMDEKPRALLKNMLETGGKAIKAAFNRVGHGDGSLEKSGRDFEKRVAEIKSRDNCSRADALKTAARECPDEFKAYQEASNSGN